MLVRAPFNKVAASLTLTLAILWGLLACVSLCTFESSSRGAGNRAHVSAQSINVVGWTNDLSIEPVNNNCLCTDISVQSTPVQQREGGDQPLLAELESRSVGMGIGSSLAHFGWSSDVPEYSLPRINAPPLFLRLRTFRI